MTNYAFNHHPRRDKRDRTALNSKHSHDIQLTNDPDQRTCAHRHRTRRGILESSTGGETADNSHSATNYLAFASIGETKSTEKIQDAGASSAAACIVLELPRMKSIITRGRGNGDLILLCDNSTKRRKTVPSSEIQTWRNSTNSGNHRFKPVFTHQFFTDENIKGYRPTDGAIEEARLVSLKNDSDSADPSIIHPSFSYHFLARHTISVQVRLSPSCRKCCLVVEIGKVAEQTSCSSCDDLHLKGEIVSLDENEIDPNDKHVRKRARTHQQTIRQTRRMRSVSISSNEHTNDKISEKHVFNFQECCKNKDMGGHLQIKAMESLRRRRSLRHENKFRMTESDFEPDVSSYTSPRPVTDISDSPSSDEDTDTPNSDRSKRATLNSKSRSLLFRHEPSSFLTRMKVGTIITQLSAGLPDVAAVLVKDNSIADEKNEFKILSSNVKSTKEIEHDYLDKPIGDVVYEYSRERSAMSLSISGVNINLTHTKRHSQRKVTDNFVLTLADMRSDNHACKYHGQVEKLSQFFIESSSPVNIGKYDDIETTGGFWKVLYLFAKHSQGAVFKYSFAGYMTLFYGRSTMTVCQAMCLPPYQRSGHGTEMLRTAYNFCDGKEIHVESPAPAFVALRNRLDYVLVRSLIEQQRIIPPRFTQPFQLFKEKATPLPDNIIVKVGSILHITAHQVEIAFNIWKLGELEKSIRSIISSSGSTEILNSTISSMEMNYKRVLNVSLMKSLRENMDDSFKFDSLDRQEQEKLVEDCFHNTIVRYRNIIYG